MLTSIEIGNFRSCDSVRLSLNEPLVALVGKNGAGKTNLLHAIHLVAELCIGEPDSRYRLTPHDRSKPVTLSLEFSIAESHYRYQTSRNSSGVLAVSEMLERDGVEIFKRDGEQLSASIEPFRGGMAVPAQMGSLFLLTQLAPTGSSLSAILRPISAYLRGIRYYPLLHRTQEHSERHLAPFIEAAVYERWKLALASGRPSDSVPMRILHMHLTKDDRLEEIQRLLGDDGLELISEIRVEEVKLRGRRTDASLEVAYTITFVPCSRIAGAGHPFRYSGLSEGTWRVVRLLTYLIFDESSCMLVEQPEDSIHSGLMGNVIDILDTYSDRTQLVCTTHSPRVMNLVGARGIRIVTADNGRTAVAGLTDAELLASKSYLLDEGSLAEFLDTL